MQQQMNTRMLVMEMLLSVTEKKQNEYSHIVVRGVLNKYNYLPQQEKSFIKRLFEGTLERLIELDYCINCFSKVTVAKMKPVIRTVMRMSVYQILYMDSVPDAAACNEAVKLVQKKGFSTLKGFVNGVLRTIARNKDNLQYPDLSITYSMPEWIVKLWMEQFGEQKTEQILQELLEERPVTIRFRNHKTMEEDVAAVKTVLEKQEGGIEPHAYLPYAYKIFKTDDITRLPGYDEGKFVVQDVSSMLAVEALNLKNLHKQVSESSSTQLTILDLCAAPGGKSILAADLLKAAGIEAYRIESGDISESKVMLMNDNFQRCGLNQVTAVVWDAVQANSDFYEKADIVIADVPCSGLGVIGKKHDIKYKITSDAIHELTALQKKILRTAEQYLKKGGRLLFSTCTINQEENEKHFAWIEQELHLTPVPLNEALPALLHSDTTQKGYLQLLPGMHDADGFFISVFTKSAVVS